MKRKRRPKSDVKAAHAAAQKRHSEAKKEAGYRRMCVMVPDDGRDDFRRAVERLKNKWSSS